MTRAPYGPRLADCGLRLMLVVIVSALLAACDSPQDPITIEDAWSPATPPAATVAAVYMRISATAADVLVAAATPVAERAEMHTTLSEGGITRMRALDQVAIAAGETVRFEPGGRHFMLTNLHTRQSAGGSFPLTLRFEATGDITVDVAVRSAGR
jgi:periplasmic copper chaperone A